MKFTIAAAVLAVGAQAAYKAPPPASYPSYETTSSVYPYETAPTYPGEKPTYPGEKPPYETAPASYPGEKPTYPGEKPPYETQPASYPGEKPTGYPGGKPSPYPSKPSYPQGYPHGKPSYTTEVVQSYETYCAGPTDVYHNGKTYHVTEATTLTITDCPCTITKPVYTTSAVYCNTCGGAETYPTAYPNATTPKSYPTAVTAGAGRTVALSGAGLAAALGFFAFVL